jgi:hypothetical protein
MGQDEREHAELLMLYQQATQDILNRAGFVGGLIPREDGAHGTTEQVLP